MDFDDITKRTLRCLEWERLKTFLAHEAESASGRAACLLVEPSSEREEVLELLAQTDEALAMLQARSALSVAGMPDIAEAVERSRTGASLNGRELVNIKITLELARQTKASLSLLPDDSFPRMRSFIGRLHSIDEVIRSIDQAWITLAR